MPLRQRTKPKDGADLSGLISCPSGLGNLPNELLYDIADRVRTADILAMVEICKQLQALLAPLLLKARWTNLETRSNRYAPSNGYGNLNSRSKRNAPSRSYRNLKLKRNRHVSLNYQGVDFSLNVILTIAQDSKKAQWPKSLVSMNCEASHSNRPSEAAFKSDVAEFIVEFITGCSYIPDLHRQYLLDRVLDNERENLSCNLKWMEPTLLVLIPNLEKPKIGVGSERALESIKFAYDGIVQDSFL